MIGGEFSRVPLRERFWRQVKKAGVNDCWHWSGTVSQGGYGQIKDHYRTRNTHRVSYELHHGPIPQGRLILHHCDNRVCVNPRHLYVGTPADNARDKTIRNRYRCPRGERHHNSKLTSPDVLKIFHSKQRGMDLAARYSICESTVCQIRRGHRWQWLTSQNANQRAAERLR